MPLVAHCELVVIVCKLTSSSALVLIPILIGLETPHGKEIRMYCQMLPFRAGHKRRAPIKYVAWSHGRAR
ncbi:hypothetical protein BDR04DRAFT_1109897 [Suillus decipiens]|nr:hypothetical protein BDR04DRAFT_1109897 [Suillus decipiens]